MGSRYRIGAVLSKRVFEVVTEEAALRGISASAFVCMLVVERLLADGKLTKAELLAAASDDAKEDA